MPLALVTAVPRPMAGALRQVLELLLGWEVRVEHPIDPGWTDFRRARLVVVLSHPAADDPWQVVRGLLADYFRGRIVIWDGGRDFLGLAEEGVHVADSIRTLATIAGLWPFSQVASRPETRGRAALRDEQLLERIARGDNHAIPPLDRVAMWLRGDRRDEVERGARQELRVARGYLDRFAGRASGDKLRGCVSLEATLRRLIARESIAGTVSEIGQRDITKEWEEAWRAFARATAGPRGAT